MEAILIFLVPFLLGASDDAPARMPPPPPGRLPRDEQPAPPPPPVDEPITIAMMKEPQPMPEDEDDAPNGGWRRIVLKSARADRTSTDGGSSAFGNTEDELPIPDQVREPLEPGAWIVARLWLSSDWAPAQKKNRPAAAFWSWSGARQSGSVVDSLLVANEVVGQDRPRMDWVNCRLRINIAGELELAIVYPGKTHTGDERGRKYIAVLEWDVLPAKPA